MSTVPPLLHRTETWDIQRCACQKITGCLIVSQKAKHQKFMITFLLDFSCKNPLTGVPETEK